MSRLRRGFTLVEILVVMGLIVLLLSILMPVLGSARESGRSAKCGSNLRQFGLAVRMYLNNSGGLYPPVRPDLNPDGTAPLVDVGDGGLKIRPRMPAILARYIEGGISNPSTSDERQDYDNPLLLCPTVSNWTDERNTAYGYNYQFLGNNRNRSGVSGSLVNYPVNEGAVTKTARTILMGDCMGTAAAFARNQRTAYEAKGSSLTAMGNHSYTLDPPYLPSHVTGRVVSTSSAGRRSALDPRHNGQANALFCDGHVEALTLADAGYDVANDGSVTHGWRTDGAGGEVATGTNRYFSGDFTNKPPPFAD